MSQSNHDSKNISFVKRGETLLPSLSGTKILANHEKDYEEEELERLVLGKKSSLTYNSDSNDESSDEGEDVSAPKKAKAAWADSDDEEPLKSDSLDPENTERLKRRHEDLFGIPEWAKSKKERAEEKKRKGKKKRGERESVTSSEEEEESSGEEEGLGNSFSNNIGHLVKPTRASSLLLEDVLLFKKIGIVNREHRRHSPVVNVEFHPTMPVILVANQHGTVTLFQMSKTFSKLQTIAFKGFPISQASFSQYGREIIAVSGFERHFFSHDLMTGTTSRIRLAESEFRDIYGQFAVSPDQKYIVLFGYSGNLYVYGAKSKERLWIMKQNTKVTSASFSPDGSTLYSHGGPYVYVWDMKTRRCVHKFADDGVTFGLSTAADDNGKYFVTGSDSGVVNVYDASKLRETRTPQPLKTIMNLTTAATNIAINPTSELMLIASKSKEDAVKAVHFPSMRVFKNFPAIQKFGTITSMVFSPNSGYFAVGNKQCLVYLFQLPHYYAY